MPLRMQTPQMIPNTIAGKNMNVITTLANSVVAISTNINTGLGITSTTGGHPGGELVWGHTKLDQIITSSHRTPFKLAYCMGCFKLQSFTLHNHNQNCTVTYMYNNFENMLTAQHQTSLGRDTAHLQTYDRGQRQIC